LFTILKHFRLLPLLGLLLFAVPSYGAVANDGSGTPNIKFTSVTSATITTFTVGAGANTCLVAQFSGNTGVTGVSLSWDSVTMTKVIDYNDTHAINQAWVLIAPHAGNKTLSASWTGSSSGELGLIEFSGADQTTCYNSADNQTNTSAGEAEVVIPSAANDATVALDGSQNCFPSSSTQTSIYGGGSELGAGSYALGGSSNTHHFMCGNSNSAVGLHILAFSGGGAAASTIAGPSKNVGPSKTD
jgi:hypothetical protein